MPRAYSVVLPRETRAVFPDRCPFTGLLHPHATVRLLSRDGMAGRALWAGWFTLRVPCVPEHRVWVHLQRAWSFCRTVVVGLGSCAFAAFFLFASLQDVARGWLSFGFTVLCICALVAWEQFVPPAFTVFVRAHGVSYEFRDRCYAAEFAFLNRAVLTTPASERVAA